MARAVVALALRLYLILEYVGRGLEEGVKLGLGSRAAERRERLRIIGSGLRHAPARVSAAPVLFVSGEYPPDVGGVGDYTERLRARWPSAGGPAACSVGRRCGAGTRVRWSTCCARRRARGSFTFSTRPAAYDLLGDVCLMPGLLRVARPAVRVVTTFHDVRVPYVFPRAGRFAGQAVRLLAKSSHAVIAADERDLRRLGGPSARHFRVPIGPNVLCAPMPGMTARPSAPGSAWRPRIWPSCTSAC